MKKIAAVVIIVLLLFVGGIFLFRHHQTQSIITQTATSPTPSVEPTSNSSAFVGSPLPFPLTVPSGYTIGVFAKDLGNARDLELTPGGTILVSVPNSNQVIALWDEKGNGVASQKVALQGQNMVHGLAFHNNFLYVAELNSLNRYTWNETAKTATFDKKLLTLPGTTDHTYHTLVFGTDNKMYISIGSDCNVCNENNPWLGSVIVADADGSNARVFSKGLRNAPFLAVNPTTKQIWSTGMGRDYLGDSIPPDEINILQDGRDFGWPTCYGNKVHDTQFDKRTYIQDPCKNTIPPIYEIPAHSAPLGLAFIPASFNPDWAGDLLVAYHGSWNRTTKIGYKVVHLKVSGNTITGSDDFITGFLQNGNDVLARPVDVLFDQKGNLYISDDKSGYVFIVKKQSVNGNQ